MTPTAARDHEPSPRDRLIVALDVPGVEQARAMTARIGEAACFYKIGMELAYGGGFDLVRALVDEGKKVFLDLKLHDIPNTVEKAARQVSRLGAVYLTVHAYPQTMKAALAGVAGTDTQILGVTVMTSMTDADLAEAGYAQGVADTVARRADQARAVGVAGLILSPHELAAMRARVGRSLRLITPGVRPAGAALGDQKRVATPGGAIRDGADALVVGRPVTEADDPAQAARAIVAEIAAAQSGR
ncbi:MAG: orotidine-5'-phosphate decarboxylase [Rhodoblastus sp.]|nr:MAG: orotidine-5'-phosphate decarboxylase [Rhodoblastus sp.]